MNNDQVNGKKPITITLNEAKRKARNSATKSTNEILVQDIYQNVSVCVMCLALFMFIIFINNDLTKCVMC